MDARCLFPLLLALGCTTPAPPTDDAPAPRPFTVVCTDPAGAPITGASVTLHWTNDDEHGPLLVWARDERRIGCTTTYRGIDRPLAVRLWPRATLRGRVHVPAGHAAPVHVAIASWRTQRLPHEDRWSEQGIERAWSHDLQSWLPAVAELETTAAADGSFALPFAAGAEAVLAFSSEGLAMHQLRANAAANVDVTLKPEARAAVTVLDGDAQPIAGALVSVTKYLEASDANADLDPRSIKRQQRTAIDGTTSIGSLTSGSYFVSCRVPDGPWHTVDAAIESGHTTGVTLRTDRLVLLRGLVRDENARGVANVAVAAIADVWDATANTITDATGAYTLRVPRRALTVRLDAVLAVGSYCTIYHDVDLTGVDGRAHTLDFVLKPR